MCNKKVKYKKEWKNLVGKNKREAITTGDGTF
jgi:hypothetical protein